MVAVESPRERTDAFLEVRNVGKSFGALLVLKDVSMSVAPGEFVCILGPSGCGKTTLLRIIAGLETQDAGQVVMAGQDISAWPTSKRGCGIVFQSYALFPNLTSAQNVAYGLHGRGKDKAAVQSRVKEMLALVGLESTANKYPAQMSGGQQQRIALARALATEPKLLLLDEPLSALDARVRLRLRLEIRQVQQRLGITTIMVTHDQDEALTMADRIVVMSEGRLAQYATPREVYGRPADPFVADFVGAMNFLGEADVVGEGQVKLGAATLDVDPERLDGRASGSVIVAIRPEDVRVGQDAANDANRLATKIEYVEFRGPFFRYGLRVPPDAEGREHFIEVDVAAKRAEALPHEPGADIEISLPAHRLHCFDAPVG
ncbi:MAG: putative 2-aminoethylphosphonate ABC transporter ATP-binding protein [Deltaproteobacteria bacterium]|nr:putative 2-aminoethylphosphonate ABC transporter ATP-binding protein [Deltaproteobacteria bacterium]